MNTAFGAGNWDDLRFETANVASLFSANYSLIYLDGSDSNATELEAFLNSHLFTIEATVFALGSTTVVPGGNTTFTVTVTPGALGARPAAIHIANAESLRCMSHPAASS